VVDARRVAARRREPREGEVRRQRVRIEGEHAGVERLGRRRTAQPGPRLGGRREAGCRARRQAGELLGRGAQGRRVAGDPRRRERAAQQPHVGRVRRARARDHPLRLLSQAALREDEGELVVGGRVGGVERQRAPRERLGRVEEHAGAAARVVDDAEQGAGARVRVGEPRVACGGAGELGERRPHDRRRALQRAALGERLAAQVGGVRLAVGGRGAPQPRPLPGA
jgi:hypothetical protein